MGPINSSLADLHAPAAAAIATAAAALLGAVAGAELVVRGLRQLEVTSPRHVRVVGVATGLIAGVAAVLAARHVGSWWLLPPALVWAFGLTAAATCDALAQRVPTPLVRQFAVLTAAVLIGASAASGQWHWIAASAVVAVSAGALFWFCWRFLGAGFGDVRIAVLGGLGLAGPSHAGIAVGIGAFTVMTLGQAAVTLARGGNLRTRFPYGPAIAAAFLLAAVV